MYTKNRLKKTTCQSLFFQMSETDLFFHLLHCEIEYHAWVVFFRMLISFNTLFSLSVLFEMHLLIFFYQYSLCTYLPKQACIVKVRGVFCFGFFFCKKIFFYLYLLKTFCEIYIKCNSKIKFGAVSFCHFVLSHLGMLNSLLSSNAIRY